MSPIFKKTISTAIKICIAVLGLWFVIRLIDWNDTARLASGTVIRNVTFINETPVTVVPSPQTAGGILRVSFGSSKPLMKVATPSGDVKFNAVVDENTPVPGTSEKLSIPNELEIPRSYLTATKGEIVQVGLRSLLITAKSRWWFLATAWIVLITPFIVTAIRWRNLMRPQGIDLPLKKCLELTLVGQFYSILLPGITGGDLVKIVYTSRLTGSKTKSIITIILDRVIGLLALVVIGGLAAATQMYLNHKQGMPADPMLRNVLIMISLILVSLITLAIVYFSHRLRRLTGLQKLMDHPRVPTFVRNADAVLHTYRQHRGLLVWAFVISLISQMSMPISAWFAGQAFGMTASLGYYMAYIPVALLAASLPISPPQGFGVMDYIIVHFFAEAGPARASQAVALAQAIRFLPIAWNLSGAYWVITGSYSRKKMEAEAAELNEENTTETQTQE